MRVPQQLHLDIANSIKGLSVEGGSIVGFLKSTWSIPTVILQMWTNQISAHEPNMGHVVP